MGRTEAGELSKTWGLNRPIVGREESSFVPSPTLSKSPKVRRLTQESVTSPLLLVPKSRPSLTLKKNSDIVDYQSQRVVP